MKRAALSYAAGDVEGPALVLSQPLSFWGGIDVETGRIVERSHPDIGRLVTAQVLVMPGGRGSSSSSSILAESLRRGTGPLAIVLAVPDPILTVGALVAASLYGIPCPIVVCPIDAITTGDRLHVHSATGEDASIEQVPG